MAKAIWAKRVPKALKISKVLVNTQRWFNRAPQRIDRLFHQARHEELRRYCEALAQRSIRRDHRTLDDIATKALFFHAKSHYYQGQWEQAAASLEKLFHYLPWHADGRYLAADTERLAGNHQAARRHLEVLYPHCKRLKTWLYLAELVQTPDDWQRMQHCMQHAHQLQRLPTYHPSLNDYFAKGAQRGGDYTAAKTYWRKNIVEAKALASLHTQPPARRVDFSVIEASDALADIQKILSSAGIQVFLVSGTLLGCMREGGLLGHDHDIDIGIWDSVDPQHLAKVVAQAGRFHLLPQRHQGCLRAKHLNGIAIDIFTHYREPTSYWHGGVKVRWHNTPFGLKQQKFLASHYWVPDDHNTYLTENYGDWKVAQRTFDSTLDTPNAEILCEQELVLHVYQQYFKAINSQKVPQIERYQSLLVTLGEPAC